MTSLTARLESATSAATAAAATGALPATAGASAAAAGVVGGGLAALTVGGTRGEKLSDSEREALEKELSELRYELKQLRASADANTHSLQAELDRLTGENVQLAAAAGVESYSGRPTAESLDGSPGAGARSARTRGVPAASPGQVAEELAALRAQLSSVQREKVELEAKLEELQEAETIIKEWSDYADTLTVERDALKQQVEELQQQQQGEGRGSSGGAVATEVAAAAALEHQLTVARLEQQLAGVQRELASAQQQREEHEQQVVVLIEERDVARADASHRMLELESLQDENERLRRAVSQLDNQVRQLMSAEAQLQEQIDGVGALQQRLAAAQAAEAAAVEEVQGLRRQLSDAQQDGAAPNVRVLLGSRSSSRHQQQHHTRDDSQPDGPGSEEADESGGSGRGWSETTEALLQERDALLARVHGLEQALHAAQSAAAAAAEPQPQRDGTAAASTSGQTAFQGFQEENPLFEEGEEKQMLQVCVWIVYEHSCL